MVRVWFRCCLVAAVLVAGVPVAAAAKTVFLGGSQTAGWKYMGCFKDVVNKAAVSNTTTKILKTLDPVVRLKPEKIFILEGVNELYSSNESILGRYREIVRRITAGSPKTMIFVQSVLPVTNRPDLSNQKIMALNAGLQAMCGEFANCIYVDLFSSFAVDGQLDPRLTSDGVHLRTDGYKLWQSLIEKYVVTPNDQITRPETVARLGAPEEPRGN